MESVAKVLGKSSVIHVPPLREMRVCGVHGEYESTCPISDRWSPCPECRAQELEAERAAEVQKAAAEKLDRWRSRVGDSGIPPRFQDRRFENFETPQECQATVLKAVRSYVRDWPAVRQSGRCMVLLGSVGTGKTHLACAAGLFVMHKHGATVLFRTVQQAVRSVRDTFAKGSGVTEGDAVARLVEPDFLILDEVGVQSGSEWEKQILFDVLNERYQQRKPTMLLSNLLDDDLPHFLGERVMDRLREDGGLIAEMGWESWRKKNAEN